MTDVPLSPGLQRLAETFNEPVQWAAGYPLVPLCQVMYPMTTGGTPHVELTEAYGLTRAGRFVPRPTEWGRSTEMLEFTRGERENREDFRRAVAEKKAPLVQVKAMPVNRPGLDPSPFSTWSGPWNRKEEALWRKLSKQEKRDWSKKFQAWKNEEWAKEGSGVPEPAQGASRVRLQGRGGGDLRARCGWAGGGYGEGRSSPYPKELRVTRLGRLQRLKVGRLPR